MPSVDTQVGLDITDAQGQVDALSAYMQSSLTDAVGTFDAAFAAGLADLTSQVTALTEALSSGLQSATSDAAAVGDALDSGLSNADGDVQNLSDSVSSLGDASSSAGGSVKELGDHTESLKGGAELAAGGVGGLTAITKDLSPGLYGAAGGALALTGGIMELYHAGLDATSAEQRFNATLGDQAKLVESIHIGDLNTQLFDLTAKMGSTKAATQNAAATIYQFAQNANASQAEAGHFAQELFALAARAVALKPSLGDVADVATRMEVGLGRARSAAQQFGISVSQAEINTRAMEDTGKSSASTLTAYEKSVAGAEIALQRYGSTLNGTIATGSQNAAIQQRALAAEVKNAIEEFGKPLVAPMLDIIRAGLPDLEKFGKSVAEIAQVILPPLAVILKAIGPAVQPAIIAFTAWYGITHLLPLLLNVLAGAVEVVGTSFVATGAAAEVAAGEIAAASALIEESNPWIAAASIALGVLVSAYMAFGGASHKAADEAKGFADQLAKTDETALVSKFNHLVDGMDATSLGADRAKVSLVAFKQVADDNVGSAQRLLNALAATGENTTKYQQILDHAVLSQQRQKVAQDQTKTSLDALTGSQSTYVGGLIVATDNDVSAAKAKDDYAKSLQKEIDLLNAASDAITAQNDKNFAVTHAEKQAADAIDTYRKSLQDSNASELDRADKLATAKESIEKVSIAARDAAVANDTSGNSAHAAAAGADAQKKALEDLKGQFPELDAFIDAYIGKLDAVPPTVYTNIFVTGTAEQQLAEIEGALARIQMPAYINVGGNGFDITGAGQSGARMAGGPVDPYGTYLVGEAGPELLTLGGSGGWVTPNHMILGNQGNSSGTGTTVSIGAVNVTVTAAPGMSAQDASVLGDAAGAAAGRRIRAIVGAL